MKVEEFGNNFYDESSEKILGEKKFPKKKFIIIISSVFLSIAALIIIIIIIISLKNNNNSKNKKGEINCIYDIPTSDRKIQILGNNYIKKNDFEIYIDNALISYSKEYQFSYPGIHNISIILYEENISMEKMFQGINSIVSVELNTDKNNIFISSIKEAFDECKNLISFSLNGFNTSKIKSFHKLFHLAQIKNIDLSKFEAKELEDISYMLSGTPIEEIEL